MASAAAVGADLAESPLNDTNDELGTSGFVTSVDAKPQLSDEDDDDDVAPRGRRKPAGRAPSVDQSDEGSLANGEADADHDLFGEDSDKDQTRKPRQLDDSELDSGDDEDRDDRVLDDEGPEAISQLETEEVSVMPVTFGRHHVPESTDGELYLLKIPSFFGIESAEFNPETFTPPVRDHHLPESQPASETFSAHQTAMRTIRWRRSPSNPKHLQSNARVLRWSDGSLTLQFASKPSMQYTMPAQALAPPQANPKLPTPTSLAGTKKSKRGNRNTDYRADEDSFTYLASINRFPELLKVTNKLTVGLSVEQAADASEDAVAKLQARMAAASRGTNTSAEGGGIGIIHVTEDPELAKKKAEIAEKEKSKALRKREAQEQRQKERAGRVLGQRGLNAGLTSGGLEDDDDMGGGFGSGRLPAIRKSRAKRRRTGEIYSDEEEEYGRRGRTREDEYDQDDGFLARSDEEEEEAEESEEDSDEGIEPVAKGSASKARPATPSGEDEAEENGARKSVEHPQSASPLARSKRRRVIEDDDEDE